MIGFIFPNPIYIGAKEPAMILMVGLALAGGGMAFNMTLSQSSRPGWQSLFVLAVVIVNILANALLIPHFGIAGAALGTLTALLVSACLTIFLSHRLIGLRIIL